MMSNSPEDYRARKRPYGAIVNVSAREKFSRVCLSNTRWQTHKAVGTMRSLNSLTMMIKCLWIPSSTWQHCFLLFYAKTTAAIRTQVCSEPNLSHVNHSGIIQRERFCFYCGFPETFLCCDHDTCSLHTNCSCELLIVDFLH